MFKAITPKALKVAEIYKAIESRAEGVKKGVLKDFQSGVKDWNHKVEFEAEVIVNPNGGVSIIVDTGDKIYFFTHEDMPPHEIRAKPGHKLRFQGTYTRKTIPGVIQSRSGGPSGEFIYRDFVMHPGSKGTHAATIILKKWKPFFEREMQRALDEGAKRSGHSI